VRCSLSNSSIFLRWEVNVAETLLDAWLATVRRHARRVAITQAVDGARVTFQQLDAHARAWAERHARAALRRRAVVFSAPNGIAWFEIFFGLLHADAVIVPLDPGEPLDALRMTAERLRAAWWDGGQVQDGANLRAYRDPRTALIKLTSGSTGAPRPLVFSAAQMLADGRQVMRGMGIGPRDLNYALIPCGHSYGLGNLTLPLLAAGVPLVCGTAPLPHAVAADFARWRPSVFPSVPAVWRALAASDVTLPGLRLAISAGAPLAPEIAHDFRARHGVTLHSFYGSSETGGISYDRSGADTLAGRVGRALPGVTLRCLRGQRLVVASAAVVTQGNRRPQTHGCGTWVMADRVEIDARGSVRLLGRSGDFVKVGGRRVSLPEVAQTLRALPGVADVWLAVSDGTEPTLGAAVITARTPAELRSLAQARLPTWKIPKTLVTLPALPLTPRGKTDTAALRQVVFGRSARA
jgi:long-chain acyl-CoA synthetase